MSVTTGQVFEDRRVDPTTQNTAPAAPTTVPPTASGSATQVASTAPASIQAFGPTPQVGTTYANAATVDPNSAQAYLAQYQQAFNQAMNPQYAQQQAQLQEQLRARGISNSGAAGQLETNLLGQQAASTAQGYEPLIAQAFGYNQSDVQQNAANQQAANAQNANASNANAVTNANFYANDVGANYNAYNQYLNTLFGAGQNQQASLLSAYLNSFGANTGVTNAMSQGLAGQQSAYQNAYSAATSAQAQQAAAAAQAYAAGG